MQSPAILAPAAPALALVAADQRLTGLAVILHAKPLVMIVMILLVSSIVAAAALSFAQILRPSLRAESALTWLAAIASGAPMLGLAAAAYGLMDGCLGLANVRPVPTLSVLAPGLAEAFFCIMLGALASAIAHVGGKHLKARLHALDAPIQAERPAPSGLARSSA